MPIARIYMKPGLRMHTKEHLMARRFHSTPFQCFAIFTTAIIKGRAFLNLCKHPGGGMELSNCKFRNSSQNLRERTGIWNRFHKPC